MRTALLVGGAGLGLRVQDLGCSSSFGVAFYRTCSRLGSNLNLNSQQLSGECPFKGKELNTEADTVNML